LRQRTRADPDCPCSVGERLPKGDRQRPREAAGRPGRLGRSSSPMRGCIRGHGYRVSPGRCRR
jgi:hypothetical protein